MPPAQESRIGALWKSNGLYVVRIQSFSGLYGVSGAGGLAGQPARSIVSAALVTAKTILQPGRADRPRRWPHVHIISKHCYKKVCAPSVPQVAPWPLTMTASSTRTAAQSLPRAPVHLMGPKLYQVCASLRLRAIPRMVRERLAPTRCELELQT
jgi:hypothetical protein